MPLEEKKRGKRSLNSFPVIQLKGGYDNKMKNKLGVFTLILALLAATFAGAAYLKQDVKVPTADEIASQIVIPAPVIEQANNSKLDELYSSYFEQDIKEAAMNATAKDLVLKDINTKDFKRAVLEVLNDEGTSVEDYKDLEIYSVKIDSVELSESSAEISVILKVLGFNDGDEDDNFKSRLTATYVVSDLEFDEGFEDSEAELDEITFEKFYE